MKNLAIIITHPIQYYAPVFQLLAKHCNLRVFYTWGEDILKDKFDPGFGKVIKWDIPLLEGYDYEWVKNIAKNPGSHHRNGINNPNLIPQIEQFQPNAILIFGHAYKSHLQAMRYFKGKTPVWFRGDSTLLDTLTPLKNILKTIYLKWVYRHIDKVFYVGTNNKTYFKKYGLKEKQLIFSPHSTANKHFAANRKKEVDKIKAELQINADEITILYAGKFEKVKNLSLLILAFNQICYTNQLIKLILVGNGPLESELKDIAKNNSNIIFMGFQNQSILPAFYQVADIFCLPSTSETWGLAINEAMAAGCAILASDKVGCVVDLVKDDINGYIFKSNEQQDLMEKINLLINDKEKLNSMKQQSQYRIQDWSFENQVQQIIKELDAC